jgi:hypothetical protein
MRVRRKEVTILNAEIKFLRYGKGNARNCLIRRDRIRIPERSAPFRSRIYGEDRSANAETEIGSEPGAGIQPVVGVGKLA